MKKHNKIFSKIVIFNFKNLIFVVSLLTRNKMIIVGKEISVDNAIKVLQVPKSSTDNTLARVNWKIKLKKLPKLKIIKKINDLNNKLFFN